ncbi:HNH homing endonuclease [Salmonella phage Mutine]|uniref:HNH homing endonuclease n=5 Tax=Kuttervirus TaxID=2169536 RepID=A0A2H5BPA6_9CAUD|nr:HNH homing endonuclease [Salmonella phage Mutine]AUG88170.1 HNH homing endonuclease [Salmonella phage Mutine]QEI24117.1 HNH homing endonuclease [Salmonella phage SS3]
MIGHNKFILLWVVVMEEIWKELYLDKIGIHVFVSNYGKIKKPELTIRRKNQFGEYEQKLPERYLVGVDNGTGYLQIKVEYKGKYFRKYLHWFVWVAFNGLVPEGFEIDHVDENKYNCVLWNLQLLSKEANMKKMLKSNPHVLDNLKKQKVL